MDVLGGRITLLRRGCGWSQTELARRLHISPSAVGMYEQGRREPSLQGLVELAAVFGVTTDYLLTGKPASEQDSCNVAKLLTQAAGRQKHNRTGGFSQEELSVLFAAMASEN